MLEFLRHDSGTSSQRRSSSASKKVQNNESVRNLMLLDTPAEERFDRLTRLAQRAFGSQFCTMTLIHEKRQWFKSVQGHSIPETPRIESFCQHTILDDRVFVVDDPVSDPRFFDLPVVFDVGSRFYAGVPLRCPDKKRVGTLCVLDTEKRNFNQEEQAFSPNRPSTQNPACLGIL